MKKDAKLSDLDRKALRRLPRLSSWEIRRLFALADEGRITLAESVKAKLRAQLDGTVLI
jgi:hypothetical protein